MSQAGDDHRYRAPALEKGLDILELLAAADGPMTSTGIVRELDRSHGKLFRMIRILEFRGYIERHAPSDGYWLSDRLFSLGMRMPRARNLIDVALPVMRQLALDVGQSCHLALHNRGEIVVVACVESSELMGYSVRVGHRTPLLQATSGAMLYAFQPEDVRLRWEKLLDAAVTAAELTAFRDCADAVRARRVELTHNTGAAGITDVSVPVMRGGAAAAALTVPYMEKLLPSLSPQETAIYVRAAADRISEQLVKGDGGIWSD